MEILKKNEELMMNKVENYNRKQELILRRKKEKEIQDKIVNAEKTNLRSQKEMNLINKKTKHEQFLEENKNKLLEKLNSVSGKVKNSFYLIFFCR